jgi:predicted Zn-dependent protease
LDERTVNHFLLAWTHDDPADGTIPYDKLGVQIADREDPVFVRLDDEIQNVNRMLVELSEPIQKLASEGAKRFAVPENIYLNQFEAQAIAAKASRESNKYSRPFLLVTIVPVGKGYLPFGFNSEDFPILRETVVEANRLRDRRSQILDQIRALWPAPSPQGQ